MHPVTRIVCQNCLRKQLPWKQTFVRFASQQQTLSKKDQKRLEREEKIIQYVGDNVKRADRVYAWGCAATGAIGKYRYFSLSQYSSS